MHIVVLDGHTLNPGDLDWEGIKALGEVTLYDRTPADQVLERCREADAVLTNKVPIGKDVLSQTPQLKYVGVTATGYNIIDTDTARQRGIMVTNVPAYGTDSVVQLTFALLLELCLHVQRHSDSVKEGRWAASPDFSFWDFPLIELAGKTMGIIGFGSIGARVADVAAAFGMQVLGSARHRSDQSHRAGFRWAETGELVEAADVVSLHCPLTPETKGLVDKALLSRMKKTAFLLNTSRGPIVVEEDLAEALASGTIAGAGLDVLSMEPPETGNPLFKAPHCIITPHIAWATLEARRRLMNMTVENLRAFVDGHPINQVNR